MATTVPNPFDTQQGGTQPMTTGVSSNTGFQQFNPLPNLTPQTYNAQTSQVNAPTETVQGQVNSILATDSPLMQRARTLATQQMNQRGLVNSSMAQGAGVAAMTDRALPIAQQDAQTFAQRTLANQDAINQQNQFNTGQTNQLFQFGQDVAARFGMQKDQQQFQGTQASLDRSLQQALQDRQISAQDAQQLRDIASREGLAAADRALQQTLQSNQFGFQGQQAQLDRTQQERLQQNQFTFQGTQSQLDRTLQRDLQTAQQNFQSAQAQLDRATQVSLADKSIAAQQSLQAAQQNFQAAQSNLDRQQQVSLFNAEQANADRRQAIQNQAELDRLGIQLDAANRQIPANFAATVTTNTMNGVNAVLSDPNMSPEAKQAAINNVVNYSNSTLAWGEKFYAAELPRIGEASLK